MTPQHYIVVITAPAARAISETLPDKVAFAVIDFVLGPLAESPKRVGVPLRGSLEGVWSARRGTYRVLYRIEEGAREVIVLRVAHRRDAYRAG